MITRIETSPSEARDVYVTVANFSNSHVFRSLDAGSTWKNVTLNLPNVMFLR